MADDGLTTSTRSARLAWAVVVCLYVLAAPLAAQEHPRASADATHSLAVGVATTSRTLRAGEPVRYTFAADPDETYLIELQQAGLDFTIEVEPPAGTARSFNSPLFRDEPEFVLLERTHEGVYSITVESVETTNATGSHTIAVSRRARSTDEGRLEALRELSEGAALNADGSPENAEIALQHYRAAAQLWDELGDARRSAQSLYSAGMLEYWSLDDWTGAIADATAAESLYRTLGEEALYANNVALRGYTLIEVARDPAVPDARATLDRAIEALVESAAIHARLGNRYDLALNNNDMGVAYQQKGELREAERQWRIAAQQFAEIGEWRWAALARKNVATVSIDEGNAVAAAATLESIIADLPANADVYLETLVLNALGAAQREAGRLTEALGSYSAARQRAGEHGFRNEEAYAFRGLGSTYFALGDLELSTQNLKQAEAIARTIRNSRVLAFALAYLGNIAYLQSDYANALELHEEAVETSASEPDKAYRRVFIARDLAALGRFAQAVAQAETALEAATALGIDITRAEALVELGRGQLGQRDSQSALTHFSDALEIYERLQLASGQAEALHGLAEAADAEGRLDAAIAYGAQSLSRFESKRHAVVAPELRAFYSASRRNYYETQIRLLMEDYEQLGQAQRLREAFSISERARARMMIDLVGEASIDLRRGMSPELLEKQRALYDELIAQRYQRDRLLEAGESATRTDRLDAIAARMAEIENELNLLEADLRSTNPDYERLAGGRVLDVDEIQSALDSDSILLQYNLGEPRSFVWVVTADSLSAVALAGRGTIEPVARAAFESLRTFDPTAAGRRGLELDLSALSTLVIAPVAPLLSTGKTKLLVVVDGALQYVPFSALPVASTSAAVPLVEQYEVIGLPSVSVWAAQKARARTTSQGTSLAVFADPVLESTDPRLRNDARAGGALASLTPGSGAASERALTRLPETATEARAIAELVPADERLIATGFDASRATVLSADLSRFDYIHFATHGLIDSRYPALSALALSQFDPSGARVDGFLRLHDIYGLDLDAKLVVLSACDTALGREILGEGLIGLTQGFLYAGAASLVVSLWQVPDRGTAELMTRFYRNMLSDGLTPAAALREAQLSLRSDRRWSDPYFWSAFTVVGNSERSGDFAPAVASTTHAGE